MRWGISCGDGWYNIIDSLCSVVQNHLDWQNCEGKYECAKETRSGLQGPVHQLVADQVKEKFGTLRFYCHGGDEYSRGVITMAEMMTGRTCEECGNIGTYRHHGWVATRCDPCEEKWMAKREKLNYESTKTTGD